MRLLIILLLVSLVGCEGDMAGRAAPTGEFREMADNINSPDPGIPGCLNEFKAGFPPVRCEIARYTTPPMERCKDEQTLIEISTDGAFENCATSYKEWEIDCSNWCEGIGRCEEVSKFCPYPNGDFNSAKCVCD